MCAHGVGAMRNDRQQRRSAKLQMSTAAEQTFVRTGRPLCSCAKRERGRGMLVIMAPKHCSERFATFRQLSDK